MSNVSYPTDDFGAATRLDPAILSGRPPAWPGQDRTEASALRWLVELVAIVCISGLSATGVSAQGEGLSQLPDSVAARIVAFYNAAGTTRFSGEGRVAAGSRIGGPVAVLGGPFDVGGTIDGDLVVINGDLQLLAGAVITGSVTVVGGRVSGEQLATVNGGVVNHREPLRFRHDAGGLVYTPGRIETELSAGREFAFGRTDFLIAARHDYNRVEGLPISFGPRIRIGQSNPTLLEGLAIYRSSAGLRIDPDQLGYSIRAEQYLGGGHTARIGMRAFSEMMTIEDLGLSNRENSLATFVLHRDYRDRYEDEGWGAYLRFARSGWPHDLTVEYREETQRPVSTGSPWSLFDNADPWRPEPVIARGTLRTISARFVYDTRNEVVDPAAGWYIVAEAEQGLGGAMHIPELTAPGTDSVVAPVTGVRERFAHLTVDVRRFLRLGPGSRLSLRLWGAGSPDGSMLPPQRQHVLGGEGTLPGYAPHQFDCGARRQAVESDNAISFPWYGCDRAALMQLEYQGAFPWLTAKAEAIGRSLNIEHSLRWVLFFDAGRAWNEPDALGTRGGGPPDFVTDIGIGVRAAGLGFYLAVPLSDAGAGFNFFVRLGRRL
jgi:Omp85 superfamily domain